jgi:hypothetical protein
VPTVHNYCGAGHGKGEHDGAGANIKHQVAMALLNQQNAAQILSAKSYYTYCQQHLTEPVHHVHASHNKHVTLTSRQFYWVGLGDIAREHAVYTSVQGIRQYHCFRTAGACSPKVHARKLSCYCGACYMGRWDQCDNTEFTGPWKRHKIPLKGNGAAGGAACGTASDDASEDQLDGSDADEVCRLLSICDANQVVALSTPDEEDEVFYLFLVKEAPRRVEQRSHTTSNATFVRGDIVIDGHFFAMDMKSFMDDSVTELHYTLHRKKETVYANQVVRSRVRTVFDEALKRHVLPSDEFDAIVTDLEAACPD